MAQTAEHIPSLAQLALEYGTISESQYTHLNRLRTLLVKEDKPADHGELLLGQRMATRYQVELLTLIREYHIIRKKGEEFGKIAVEKGFATRADIRTALDIQKKEFRKSRLRKLIGDILVESGIITVKQKHAILREQAQFDDAADEVLAEQNPARPLARTQLDKLQLSQYERDFLRIKSLDEEFSAAVLEKGLASEADVSRAKKIQETEFEKSKSIKVLGDIMVSLRLISREQKDIILDAQGRIEDMPRQEAAPVIKASDDGMSAWIEMDSNARQPAGMDTVKDCIQAEGICRGIYPDAMLQTHLSMGFKRFPVARVDLSHTLKEAKKLFSHLDDSLTERGEKRKGEILVSETSTWNTPPRNNIFGKSISGGSDLDFTVRCGNGTRKSRNRTGIVSSKTGVPALSVERYIHLHPIVHILEDADQRYGPIEAYANLTVSGTITGAYPITAGDVAAREIRGGIIDAMGDVRVRVGITDAVIRTQGDVHARYLHNCRIQAFGSVYVENEIFDSDIRCSGRMDGPDCRVISSDIYAKNGVILAGTGSQKTRPCRIIAGTDHHVLTLEQSILNEMDNVTSALRDLEAEKADQAAAAKRLFQKMVELKIFHDRAKQKRDRLYAEIKQNLAGMEKERLAKTHALIKNFDSRMGSALASLKSMNREKKAFDLKILKLRQKIKALTPGVQKEMLELERTLFAFLEWARVQPRTPEIEIRGKGFQGTTFGGVYSSVQIESDREGFIARERAGTDRPAFMEMLDPETVA